jgi:putative ABC transport system permease protein
VRYWELVCLALTGLRRTPLRVLLTAAGVAIATGALVSMVGFALGVQARVEEPFQKMELVNRIDVSARHVQAKQGEDRQMPANTSTPALDKEALGRIAALPGVALVYPELRLNSARIIHGDRSRTRAVAGLPRQASRLRFVSEALVAGRFFDTGSAPQAILGTRLAHDVGFNSPAEALGASLTLEVKGLSPGGGRAFTFAEQRLTIEVVGVWDPPAGPHGFTSDGLLLPTDQMEGLPGVQADSALERLLHGWDSAGAGYGHVVVRVERAGELFAVEGRIREMGFRTQTLLGEVKEMRTVFLLMDTVLTAVGGVALVVAGLGIVNTLLMAVLERYREIGIYKALGASNGDIRVLFLAEAALVGLLGGAGGLLLGRVVSWVLEVVVNAIARSKGIDEAIMVFAFPWQLLTGVVLFALAVSILGGVYPASRAARVDPIRALRSE